MENEKNDIEIIDLEQSAKEGKVVPKGQKYRIRVDKTQYVVDVESMTGAEILTLAGKTPVTKFQLNQKLAGGQVMKINYDQTVDFTSPGIERFMTLPLDQTEG